MKLFLNSIGNRMKRMQRAKMAAVAGAYAAVCLGIQAANIAWDGPTPIADETDFITYGSLERAYGFGYGPTNILVHGVNFVRFGNNLAVGAGTESLTEDGTTITIGGDEDSIALTKAQAGTDFAGLSSNYKTLLQSGVSDAGSPLALILNGLVAGKTYLYQSWMGDPATPRNAQTISGGTNYIQVPSQLSCYVIGTFVADSTNQTIVYTPSPGSAQINAFQLRVSDDVPESVAIIKQPWSKTNRVSKTEQLSVIAGGGAPLRYQWERVTENGTHLLADGGHISGSNSNILFFNELTPECSGLYQVVISNLSSAVTSSVARITVATNQLINVAVSGVEPVSYKGLAVLPGDPNDVWNSLNARRGFANVPLVDALGETTSVTLTLAKSGGDAVPHTLLGGISYAATQTVTINHLQPNEFYDLVVFSVGGMANEGGVFSGAVSGLTRGYPEAGTAPTDFLPGTNYVENPFARTDAHGTLTFTIKPNATAMTGGYFNCDFNGLQLMEVPPGNLAPIILQQPSSVVGYGHQSKILTALAASPSQTPLTYQWQKVTPFGTSNLLESDSVFGTRSNALFFKSLAAEDIGSYQVVATSVPGSVTSSVVLVTVFTNQLINVAVTNGSPAIYTGVAVLPGTPGDIWNGVDARTGFKNIPLADATGAATPATLTLAKSDGDAIAHPLLGGISYAASQTLTINHLLPDDVYKLGVFSVGNMANEGGVFAGAVNGMAHGYPSVGVVPAEFVKGVNFVENPYVLTDDNGTLTVAIKPNATVMPNGYNNCDFNGLQLMKVTLGNQAPIIAEEPVSAKVYLRHPKTLSTLAVGPKTATITYQWEKLSAHETKDLEDSDALSGSKTSTLIFHAMTFADAGNYRVVAGNSFGSVTSQVATITIATNQLINVAVHPGDGRTTYNGLAVLDGTPNDFWNGVDARGSFTNAPLFDSTGDITPVTLTLTKSAGDAVPHPLLGGISYASNQVLTISHLLPDEFYDLVVFSVGSQPNEGGVFSGAVSGMARGYPNPNTAHTGFSPTVNYVENPVLHTDSRGTLTFTIKPNATAMPGGYFNCDFNGLQLIEGFRALHVSSTRQSEDN